MKIAKLLLPLLAALTVTTEAAPQQRAQPPGFRVCNLSGIEIEVAKALNTGARDGSQRIIISEGWYRLPPQACTFLWQGALQYQYYLVYAQSKATNREWAGNVPICVSHEAFTIRSDTCGNGEYRRMFIQVNTGNERTRWTYNFEP